MTPQQEALIVVDYQNGFIPKIEGGTGELGVEGGGLLAPRINQLMQETRQKGGLIIATRDYHPQGHMSFASNYEGKEAFSTVDWNELVNNVPRKVSLKDSAQFTLEDIQGELGATGQQVLWPDHCVQGTPGAEYFEALDTSLIDTHIIKGYDPKIEMYSGFFGREIRDDGKIISLTEILKKAGIKTVRLVGLATDYCVASTAADAVRNGFRAIIDSTAIAGVGLKTPHETLIYLENLREGFGVDYE